MSLYEQYHSEINKNYMFNMVKDIILNEKSIDLNKDQSNYEDFINELNKTFKLNNSDELSDLNKILLNNCIEYYQSKYDIYNHNDKDKDKSDSDLNKLLKQRNTFHKEIDEMNGKTSPKMNGIPGVEMNIIEQKEINIDGPLKGEVSNVFITNKSDIIGSTPINAVLTKEDNIGNTGDGVVHYNVSKSIEASVEEEIKTLNINSSRRTNINSSRYNYKIDLTKENINIDDIKRVSRLIIPVENNYIFSIPVLKLIIPELDYDGYMQQVNIIDNSINKVGVYEPIENIIINKSNINKITIDIRDITETKYQSYDILKVNILEIINNIIIFTCSDININNFKEKDNIKIINNYTVELSNTLKYPLKVEKILKNQIFCKLLEPSSNKIYNNIDMKILNISNQNIIYFNH